MNSQPLDQLMPSLEPIWSWLDEVMDPEIPVVSVLDLGIVREVRWHGDTLQVDVCPTYSGCPATRFISESITSALRGQGVQNVVVKTVLTPPWSSAWITPRGRERLLAYGIVPPVVGAGDRDELPWRRARPMLSCPQCDDSAVERLSEFGSTPCKAQYRCTACLEPFEYFKCI
jgi:ring-1,2-phenylacetyl-CoA epoxidase subunit PaaD